MKEDSAIKIVQIILNEHQYIFSSFNNSRIVLVEDELNRLGIDYITTSQTGNDFVIATKGSSFYTKFHKKQQSKPSTDAYSRRDQIVEELKKMASYVGHMGISEELYSRDGQYTQKVEKAFKQIEAMVEEIRTKIEITKF